MARRRFAGPVLRQGQRRKTVWIATPATAFTLSAVGGTLLASLNATALALRPFTIVREHLEVWIRSDQTAAAEDQLGAIAAAVVSDEASAAGVNSVPTPVTEAGSDLFYLHQWLLSSTFGGDGGGGAVRGVRYSIDSKAMRKVDIGQDNILVGEFDASGNGFVLLVAGRTLVKLH